MRNMMKTIAMSYVGTFYSWGGDDPSGFDCSGFVIELLKSVGLLPSKFDATANDLMLRYQEVETPQTGDLVFYGRGRAVHVEMCLDNFLKVGASGGGSRTNTKADAIRDNAFVKVRPIAARKDLIKFCDPFARLT